MRPRNPERWALLALATAALCLLASMATAHTYPKNKCVSGSGCEPDNNYHTWCYRKVERTQSRNAWEAHRSYMNGFKNFTIKSTPDRCGSKTDLWLYDSTDLSGLGFFAFYQCQKVKSNGECERASVWIDDNVLEGRGFSTTQMRNAKRSLWCHEAGHSVGLAHLNVAQCVNGCGCMSNNLQTTSLTFSAYRYYTSHDRSHIENDLDR